MGIYFVGGIESVDLSRDRPNLFSYPLLTQEQVKLRTSNLAGTFIASSDASKLKPIKNFGENGTWAYPETAQFLGYPYYLRNG